VHFLPLITRLLLAARVLYRNFAELDICTLILAIIGKMYSDSRRGKGNGARMACNFQSLQFWGSNWVFLASLSDWAYTFYILYRTFGFEFGDDYRYIPNIGAFEE